MLINVPGKPRASVSASARNKSFFDGAAPPALLRTGPAVPVSDRCPSAEVFLQGRRVARRPRTQAHSSAGADATVGARGGYGLTYIYTPVVVPTCSVCLPLSYFISWMALVKGISTARADSPPSQDS